MDKKEQPKATKRPKQSDIKIKSLDIDKAEYQEIVQSQSNYHDKNHNNKGY